MARTPEPIYSTARRVLLCVRDSTRRRDSCRPQEAREDVHVVHYLSKFFIILLWPLMSTPLIAFAAAVCFTEMKWEKRGEVAVSSGRARNDMHAGVSSGYHGVRRLVTVRRTNHCCRFIFRALALIQAVISYSSL